MPARQRPGRSLRIGLVNAMPDAALAHTETQFINLLNAASDDWRVQLHRYALPGIARGLAGARYLAALQYRDVRDIGADGLDGLIVTGTEPKLPNLREEPYWRSFATLFDWIGRDGPSTIFSCLASHAAVLHFDDIERQRLEQKRFGVYEHVRVARHALTKSIGPVSRVAHSRWNEVSADALSRRGYQVLTYAPAAGVDLFVKQAHNLLLFFQGHPEYDPPSLLREYKRDIKRFLACEREIYPRIPEGYFQADQIEQLAQFESRARRDRNEALVLEFPVTVLPESREWASPALGIYRTWLSQIAARRGIEAAESRRRTRDAVEIARP